MKNFFEKRDPWGNSFAIWILAALLFVGPLVVSSVKNLRMKNDVESWLPKDDPQAQLLAWYRSHFPHEDTVIISWEGSHLEDPRVEAFARRLSGSVDAQGVKRGGSPYIKSAITPKSALARMIEHDVEPESAFEQMQGVLIGQGPLKIRLTDLGRKQKDQIVASLVQQLQQELNITVEVLPSHAEQVETSRKAMTVNHVEIAAEEIQFEEGIEWPEYEPQPHDFQISWDGILREPQKQQQAIEICQAHQGRPTGEEPQGAVLIDSAFFEYGTPVGVVVQLSENGTEVPLEAAHAIQETAASLAIPMDALHVAGSSISATTLNGYVIKAAFNPAAPAWNLPERSVIGLSACVGALLAFFTLRSIRLGVLVLFTSYYATLAVVSLVPSTGGSMNMVLIVMPTLLMVLTLSGAIHLANYWKHARVAGAKCAATEAVNMAAIPCLLASATTAIGLASLLTSNLTPVRDFGMYSAIGTGISVLFILFGLPALLQLWPGKAPKSEEIESTTWRILAGLLSRHHYWVTGACLLLFGFSIYGLQYFRTETKVIRYFPSDSQIVHNYNTLENQLSGVISVDTIIRFDNAAQSETEFQQRIEVVREVAKALKTHEEVSGTVSLASFQPSLEYVDPDAGRLARLKYIRRSNEVQKRLKEDSNAQAGTFFKVVNETNPSDPLNCEYGDELWRVTSQASIMSDIDYADLTSQLNAKVQDVLKLHPGTSHVVTGMVPIFLRTQQAVLESLIVSFGLAFGIIAVVMMVLLKNPIAGLITMLPNLLPVGLVFGLLAWMGQAVDIGTMITASVALGIAVDGTLHLLTWFRNGLEEGKTISQSIENALAHCGPAMWQTSAIVAISLIMLAPCELLLVSRFGLLMGALIGAALVADVIYLPALLAGPLGRLIQSTVTPKPDPGDEESLPEDSEPSSQEDPAELAAIPITVSQINVVKDVTRKSAN